MKVDPAVALGARRALTTLREHADRVQRALDTVRAGETPEVRQRAAMEAGMDFSALALVGELVSRPDERAALILAATDTDDEREHAERLVDSLLEGRVFRALRAVFPYSFRSRVLDEWDRYREHLKGLLDTPVWPGKNVTLREMYVPPACVFLRNDTRIEDPVAALMELWEGGASVPLLVEGDVGMGKTTVAITLADRLARREDVFPLLVSARSWGGEPLLEFVRTRLQNLGFPLLLDNTGMVWPLVLILDEVVEAADDEIGLLVHEGQIAVAIRTARFDEPGFPFAAWRDGVRLQPFDDTRVREWVRRWNAGTGANFVVEPLLLPEESPEAEDDGSAAPPELPRQPLTLLMLAEMASEGHSVGKENRWTSRAEIYRDVISWQCRRVAGTASEVVGVYRGELRVAAQRVGRSKEIPWDVVPSWHDSAAGNETADTFPLVRAGGTEYRFVHDSFAEYLHAETLALECVKMVSCVPDVDDEAPVLDEVEIVSRWLRSFGNFDLTVGVDRFLARMVPSWKRFAQGSRGLRGMFGKRWPHIHEVIYRGLTNERAFRHATTSRVVILDDPKRARARALRAVLCASGWFPLDGRLFHPEVTAPRSYPIATRLIAEANLPPHPRFQSRITLAHAHWDRLNLAGLDLAHLDLTEASLCDARLDGASFERSTLTRADLQGASLRGVRLDHAHLDGADLRRARLNGASLQGAALHDTILIDVDLAGVVLSEPQRAEAIFSPEEAARRGVELRVPEPIQGF